MSIELHRDCVNREATSLVQEQDRPRKRRQPTRRERGLIEWILRLEADGEDHSGVEIDRLLEKAARDLGYSDEELARLHKTGRSVFGNEGDFAKKKMTEERWHEVVGKIAHWQAGVHRECNVYRITPSGLDELRKLG